MIEHAVYCRLRSEPDIDPMRCVCHVMNSVHTEDVVNHPSHYTHGPMEVIDIIEGFDLGFHLGNVVKYILRANHKDNMLQDLKKARWYLDRAIKRLEK